MSKIVRIWIYKKEENPPMLDILSKQYLPRIKSVRGDFEYFEIDGESARRSTRKEADAYADKVGEPVETLMGYPAFMHDQGYRA